MIVEIPGRDDLRIEGTSLDWEVQTAIKNGKQAGEWKSTNYFPTLDSAIEFVYERKLKEDDKVLFPADVVSECRKLKNSLVREVRKAVG